MSDVTVSTLRATSMMAVVVVLAACSGPERVAVPRKAQSRATSNAAAAATTSTVAPDVCATQPVRAMPDPSRPRYRLRVDVRPSEGIAEGDLAVVFTPDVTTDRLVFRLWPNGPRLSRAGARLDTGTVTVDGAAVASERETPTLLVVGRGTTFAAGRAVDVRLSWRLRLAGTIDDRVSRSGDSARLGSFFPILGWEPGVGWATEAPTTVDAESSTAPTADFDVTATVPAGLSVLASGVQDGPTHWTATAMRDFAMSVGRFTIESGTAHVPQSVAVTVGVDAGVGDAVQPYLDKAVRVLEDFSRRFGPYAWPVYTLAITPGLRGGIEYPGHTMQGPGTIGRTTSHEIGHQWFYALVGNDQGRDPWLDEGLATYAEGRFEDTLETARIVQIPADARGHAGEAVTFWESRPEAYYAGVYLQGAEALAALGDLARVDCALRLYAATAAYRVARPGNLFAALDRLFPAASEVLAGYGLRR
ncbi:MAG: M1 family metallopeptidase [Actinobacteria bacterium]|nr:MAG: M1 family metallopeptidase [Actinomycetota bacterium]